MNYRLPRVVYETGKNRGLAAAGGPDRLRPAEATSGKPAPTVVIEF